MHTKDLETMEKDENKTNENKESSIQLFLYLINKDKQEFNVSAEEQRVNYYRILETIKGT